MATPSILVIGSLNVDYVTFTSRMPLGGETLASTGFSTGAGGKGANQAVACAKLSRSQSDLSKGLVNVRMFGAVGDDPAATLMRSSLNSAGVDTSSIITAPNGEATGVAIIIVEESTGENRILLSPNANYSLTPSLFTDSISPRPDLLVMQLEIPKETVLQILSIAERDSIPVLVNPAPAQVLPESAYKAITHLVVNETEASILSGVPESDITISNLPSIAKKFLDLGTKNVLITLGGKGVFYATNKTEGHIPAQKTNVVDTTAAGDTFIGAYAVALLGGKDVKTAVEVANKAAAFTVARKGAQVSIPWMDEVGEGL